MGAVVDKRMMQGANYKMDENDGWSVAVEGGAIVKKK